MSRIDTILAQLPKLSPSELDSVLARARALRAFSGAPVVPEAKAAALRHDWAVEGMRSALATRGLRVNFPDAVIAKWSAYRTFNKNAPAVISWLEKHVPEADRTTKLALGEVVADALIAEFTRWKEPPALSLQTFFSFFQFAPQALERSYPGYAEQGWLRLLVKQRALRVCPTSEGENPT